MWGGFGSSLGDELGMRQYEPWDRVNKRFLLPSPLWGRGWLATGVLISRGEKGAPRSACCGGEGVKTVHSARLTGAPETQKPRRQHRSMGRDAAQIDCARELCQTETESEQAAWQLLRTIRLAGCKFRRQHPLGPYVVDFYCPQRRLVVELDGSVHGQPSQARWDAHRDAQLRSMGYTVARFSNGMILNAPEVFLEKVLSRVRSLTEASADQHGFA